MYKSESISKMRVLGTVCDSNGRYTIVRPGFVVCTTYIYTIYL